MSREDEVGELARTYGRFRAIAIERVDNMRRSEEQRLVIENERKIAESEREARAQEQSRLVQSLADGLGKLAAYDLTWRWTEKVPDAYGKIQTDFNATRVAARSRAAGRAADRRIGPGSADEIRSAADELSHRTEQQAASLEETTAALREVTETVKRSATSAANVSQIVGETKLEAERSSEVARKAVGAISEIENPRGISTRSSA